MPISKREAHSRVEILKALDASRPFMESSRPWDIAIELVAQGLNIVPPDLRFEIVKAAKRELDE